MLFSISFHVCIVFRVAGIDLKRPLVTTRYIGHTASLMALVACLCGKNDTPIYYVSLHLEPFLTRPCKMYVVKKAKIGTYTPTSNP